jgi:hypothetical protein
MSHRRISKVFYKTAYSWRSEDDDMVNNMLIRELINMDNQEIWKSSFTLSVVVVLTCWKTSGISAFENVKSYELKKSTTISCHDGKMSGKVEKFIKKC